MALGPKTSQSNSNSGLDRENIERDVQNSSPGTFSFEIALSQQESRREVAQQPGRASDPVVPRRRELHFLSKEWANEFSDL
eukprot:CAMPEP_0183314890 /NCGR_PEP_ID=MMETSP0160_2-20130417/50018_1 /TAXON_ID=2839 ORGANISM="Odontella Sinensis, Strain Grunow 1884" /NCGR_SAMPLE_ID=MMETSP0160_2 /ASSEMBLY_ACC=CAM_ASM_000250 /LENGTH=80 /DNA_ID=CAMNT_0025480323 /DNA_START=58 /DNA_END=297 /DNA_ORIENTATION=+